MASLGKIFALGAALWIGQAGGCAWAQEAAPQKALTATEQAAVSQILNRINELNGAPLQVEIARLSKEFIDAKMDLPAIMAVVKVGAGAKLGQVNTALREACSAQNQPILCTAADVQAVSLPESPIQTAALDGGAGGAGGGGGATTGDGGSTTTTTSSSTTTTTTNTPVTRTASTPTTLARTATSTLTSVAQTTSKSPTR